jgi:hypothetical protein
MKCQNDIQFGTGRKYEIKLPIDYCSTYIIAPSKLSTSAFGLVSLNIIGNKIVLSINY